ncbi:MAG: cytochrome C, partial [Granulosicoccus sp.]|nr:cytochrome C [Granulosicoccus sp.]
MQTVNLKHLMLTITVIASTYGSGPAAAQDSIDVQVGRLAYVENCAACHGVDAAGDGPLSSVLTTKPANLKELREANDGRFPLVQVYSVIDGREAVRGHGTREMPVWGWVFSQEAQKRHLPPHYGGDSEDLVQSRILQLVYYLHSI